MTIRDGKGARAAKAKGRTWENDVVDLFRAAGFSNAERRRQRGIRDAGDIAGIPGLVVECKNERKITLSLYLDELLSEVAEAPEDWGVVALKRRGKSVNEGYAVMRLEDFARLWVDYMHLDSGRGRATP